MAESVSWYAIEPGWDVADPSGELVGEVTAVVGDTDADIFDGLRFETVDGDERFVAGERVGEIVDGCVSLDAALADIEAAPDDLEPGGAEIRPEPGGEL